jgi:hypothetical protein
MPTTVLVDVETFFHLIAYRQCQSSACLRHFEDGASTPEDPKALHHLLTVVHRHPVNLSIPESEILEDVLSLRFLPKVPGGSHRNYSYIRSLLKERTPPSFTVLDSLRAS